MFDDPLLIIVILAVLAIVVINKWDDWRQPRVNPNPYENGTRATYEQLALFARESDLSRSLEQRRAFRFDKNHPGVTWHYDPERDTDRVYSSASQDSTNLPGIAR